MEKDQSSGKDEIDYMVERVPELQYSGLALEYIRQITVDILLSCKLFVLALSEIAWSVIARLSPCQLCSASWMPFLMTQMGHIT